MRVLVAGATGRVGRRVVDQLLAAGHTVTGLARTVESLPATVRAVPADIRDRDAVADAMEGQDAVVSALGTPPEGPVDDTLSAGIDTLLSAMAASGITRLVVVGAAGVLDAPGGGLRLDAPDFPPFLRAVADQHRQVYEALDGSDLTWTLVCPPNMPDGDATGRARTTPNQLPEGGQQVRTGDVAAFVVTALENDVTGRVGIAD